MERVNLDRHIWEGWRVCDFIDELQPNLDMLMDVQYGTLCNPMFTTRQELKEWCMDNQPYYKKYIPEVVAYFWERYKPYISCWKKRREC